MHVIVLGMAGQMSPLRRWFGLVVENLGVGAVAAGDLAHRHKSYSGVCFHNLGAPFGSVDFVLVLGKNLWVHYNPGEGHVHSVRFGHIDNLLLPCDMMGLARVHIGYSRHFEKVDHRTRPDVGMAHGAVGIGSRGRNGPAHRS